MPKLTFSKYYFHRQELGTLGNCRNYQHQVKRAPGSVKDGDTKNTCMKHIRSDVLKSMLKTCVCIDIYTLKTRACSDAQAGLQLVPQPQVLREWNSLWASPVNIDEEKKQTSVWLPLRSQLNLKTRKIKGARHCFLPVNTAPQHN